MSLWDPYGMCTNSRRSLAVWINQNETIPGQIPDKLLLYFPELLLEKDTTRSDPYDFRENPGQWFVYNMKQHMYPDSTSGQISVIYFADKNLL